MCETKRYIADIVGDDYKEWNNERIKFDAGTGTGKTTFCLEVLGTYAKETERSVLYLCNRVPLRDEKNEIVENLVLNEVITVKTYQAVETILKCGDKVDYYDYVIADEAHYFMADSQFNSKTTISFQWISSLSDCVVIFASATAKRLFSTIEGRLYKIPNTYEYVEKIVGYTAGQLVPILKTMLKEEPDAKAVVFVNSADRMLKLHELFSEQLFYCSHSSKNRSLKRICVEDLPIVDGKLKDTSILFTTKVLDNGVDIKDASVKYVFSELADMASLIQSLGRWRKPDDDSKVTFCVMNYGNEQLNRYLNTLKGQYKLIAEFRRDPEAFRNKNKSHPKFIRYHPQFNQYNGCEIEVDESSAMEIEENIRLYERAMNTSWMQLLLEEMGIEGSLENRVNYSRIEPEIKKQNKALLKEYLRSIENKTLYYGSPEMRKTKEMIEYYGELTFKAKRLKYPLKIWNALLDTFYENTYRYRFSVNGKRDLRRKLPDGSTNPYLKKTYHLFTDGLGCSKK